MLVATTPIDREDRLTGVLLGTAVGDALGVPREGLSRRRAARLFGASPLEHRFVLGRGMISDDAEHACMAAQALLAAPGDAGRFARSLGWRLRGWLAALPAGVGLATLRAIAKLWLGFSPERSGVFSAGNGAAMRAPILGASLAHEPSRIEPLVRASTRLTHTDPRAEEGARILALAAAYAAARTPEQVNPAELLAALRDRVADVELRRRLDCAAEHLARRASAEEFAAALGLDQGVSGFILDTAPAALFCWLAHPGDFRRAVEDVILLGGDADSTGAIVGGLAGATLGARAIPEAWVNGIADYPRSVAWMRRLGARLARAFPGGGAGVGGDVGAGGDAGAAGTAATAAGAAGVAAGSAEERSSRTEGPLGLFWPILPARNLLFLVLALGHGFRRMLPPY
ncbi:ADP-ribosylglycohydrolase family protein [Sorangium sp. So ce131]|uniref:ADP-ribosylglycohydrolase family protein n=1 Tax=Sorangium sp. So ce131 TaxID=3133282 RepID=UPI003F617021